MKIHFRTHYAKPLIFALLAAAAVFVLIVCQEKETLPQPEFPLQEAALTAALKETGLSWSIKLTEDVNVETTTSIIYSLHRLESGVDYNTAFVNSYDSDEFSHRLQVNFCEPQKKQLGDKEVRWEDWQDTIVLAARLYGGLEDAFFHFQKLAENVREEQMAR